MARMHPAAALALPGLLLLGLTPAWAASLVVDKDPVLAQVTVIVPACDEAPDGTGPQITWAPERQCATVPDAEPTVPGEPVAPQPLPESNGAPGAGDDAQGEGAGPGDESGSAPEPPNTDQAQPAPEPEADPQPEPSPSVPEAPEQETPHAGAGESTDVPNDSPAEPDHETRNNYGIA